MASSNLLSLTADLLNVIAVVGAVFVMVYGLNIVYKRLKSKDQGFGPASIRTIGIVLFIPTLLILAIITDFQTETLAALLGTVAGYVLSKPSDNDGVG